MSPKEAMLSLIINGLVDKFAKQKALQTVESLFKNESCREELCKLANKFVNENAEELILIGRVVIKDEPMDETVRQNPEEEAMEVDSQTNSPYYADDLLYLILKGFENDKVRLKFQQFNFNCFILDCHMQTRLVNMCQCRAAWTNFGSEVV